jgi:hypothetical protein
MSSKIPSNRAINVDFVLPQLSPQLDKRRTILKYGSITKGDSFMHNNDDLTSALQIKVLDGTLFFILIHCSKALTLTTKQYSK